MTPFLDHEQVIALKSPVSHVTLSRCFIGWSKSAERTKSNHLGYGYGARAGAGPGTRVGVRTFDVTMFPCIDTSL